MPGPAVAAHVGERTFCFPSENIFGEFGTGFELWNVSWTSRDDVVRDADPCDFFETPNYFEHA